MLAIPPALAQADEVRTYDIPAQRLSASLQALSVASGQSIVASADIINGRNAPRLAGSYTIDGAIALLLVGSNLRARRLGNAIVIVDGGDAVDAPPSGQKDILVTGTRIRGAGSPSPLIELDRETMASAGRTNVTDVIRTIPQNFGGGQNPGVGFNVPQSSGADVGGGSSINLRGLGSAATLTLLNGHRLAYSGAFQGVDISAIPFAAIDRIDVVADGASTIYGSDAVAGVVNVILRPRFHGLQTSAKLAGTTDGGNFEQQYSAIAGTEWAGGGLFAAYEFNRNTPIISNQRDYAANRPGVTLYPGMQRDNIAARFRQALTSALTFSVDGLYNARSSSTRYPLNAAGDLSVSSGTTSYATHAFSVAPELALSLGSSWQLDLSGSYSADKVGYAGTTQIGATRSSAGAGFYRNRGTLIELAGDGNLIRLPGGMAKLALGGGYRWNGLVRFAGAASASNIDADQRSGYAFAELSAPVLPIVSASAAVRYEHYAGIGSVATPKFGLIVSPLADLDIKGSWGRSFRAPSLYQQYQPAFVYLAPASQYGGAGLPTGSTVLYQVGGNPGLKPERSANWSVTVDLHPKAVPGLRVEVSYFSIDYTDRIVTPILFPSTSLTNSVYAAYVTRAPSAAAQNALIGGAGTFTNLVGGTYDPSRVAAIVRNNAVNAGRQTLHGIDAQAGYRTTIGADTFGGSVAIGYLSSDQQLTALQPVTPLAGILFNPPKLRGRGEVSWQRDGLGVVANLNVIGPVRDTRVSGQSIRIAGLSTADLTIRYRTKDARGFLSGIDVSASAQNIFNDTPTRIATSVFLDTPYDSTNYTPFGRTLSLAITKAW